MPFKLPFRLKQKGAMYGLDSRVALVIFASLSTIAGASIIFNRLDATAAVMHSELKAMHEAVKQIQNDFQNDLYSSLDNLAARQQNAVTSMYENTPIDATHQGNWFGPYLDEFIQPGTRIYKSQNNVVGITFVSIMKHAKQNSIDNSATCSNADPCYYWVRINSIPVKLAEAVNKKIDGSAETVPENEGRFQWNDAGSSDIVNIWYVTEQALDNNNASIGL